MTYRDAVLASAPDHYWRLNEGPGATAAMDLGARPQTLWTQGNPTASAVFPTSPGFGYTGITADGGAMNVGSANLRVKVGGRTTDTSPRLPLPDPGTLELWAFTEDPVDGWQVAWLNPALPNTGWTYGLFGTDSTLDATLFQQNGIQNVASYASAWHHFALSWSAGVGFLYADGTQVQPLNTGLGAGTGHVEFDLGNPTAATTSQINTGLLTEVAIYPRALSVGDLDAHFDQAELKAQRPAWKPPAVQLPGASGPPVASYSVGVTHLARTGAGVITVPTGLRGILSTIQSGVPTNPELPGTPPYEWNVGWQTISDANGMLAQLRLTRQRQIWLPDNFALGTQLGYYLNPGFTVDFAELDPS